MFLYYIIYILMCLSCFHILSVNGQAVTQWLHTSKCIEHRMENISIHNRRNLNGR